MWRPTLYSMRCFDTFSYRRRISAAPLSVQSRMCTSDENLTSANASAVQVIHSFLMFIILRYGKRLRNTYFSSKAGEPPLGISNRWNTLVVANKCSCHAILRKTTLCFLLTCSHRIRHFHDLAPYRSSEDIFTFVWPYHLCNSHAKKSHLCNKAWLKKKLCT